MPGEGGTLPRFPFSALLDDGPGFGGDLGGAVLAPVCHDEHGPHLRWMILARQVGQKPSDHAFLVVRGYDHTKPKRGRRWSGPPVAPSPEGGDRVVADEGEQGCLRKQEENP